MRNRKGAPGAAPTPASPAAAREEKPRQTAAEQREQQKYGATDLRSFLRADGRSSNPGGSEDEKPTVLLQKEDPGKRLNSFLTRTASTVVLIGGFIFVVWAGHVPLLFFVLALQALMIREAFGLGRMDQEERKLPGFRLQQWYFFFVVTFYLYLRFISTNLLVEVTSTKLSAKLFSWALKRHMIISYFLYCAGFMSFVLSLKRGMYLYQFMQYAWTHMIILTVIMPTSFFVSNTFQGIIWYVMPAMLIVINDIFAYLAGFFFGRTPLIRLSPKKTWEGFIGAFICTALFAFFASRVMARSKWLTCPRKDLSLGPLRCEPSPTFQDRVFSIHDIAQELPGPLEEVLTLLQALLPAPWWDSLQEVRLTIMPVQLHAMTMSFFASLISPFGGFFASGFKRAFKLKDFGHTIPGHGGITDRFDCQVLMAMFSYLYYWNYIHSEAPSVGEVLAEAVKLPDPQQLELFLHLGNLLIGGGMLPDGLLDSVRHLMPAPSAGPQ